jgi:hypothetical protein
MHFEPILSQIFAYLGTLGKYFGRFFLFYQEPYILTVHLCPDIEFCDKIVAAVDQKPKFAIFD